MESIRGRLPWKATPSQTTWQGPHPTLSPMDYPCHKEFMQAWSEKGAPLVRPSHLPFRHTVGDLSDDWELPSRRSCTPDSARVTTNFDHGLLEDDCSSGISSSSATSSERASTSSDGSLHLDDAALQRAHSPYMIQTAEEHPLCDGRRVPSTSANCDNLVPPADKKGKSAKKPGFFKRISLMSPTSRSASPSPSRPGTPSGKKSPLAKLFSSFEKAMSVQVDGSYDCAFLEGSMSERQALLSPGRDLAAHPVESVKSENSIFHSLKRKMRPNHAKGVVENSRLPVDSSPLAVNDARAHFIRTLHWRYEATVAQEQCWDGSDDIWVCKLACSCLQTGVISESAAFHLHQPKVRKIDKDFIPVRTVTQALACTLEKSSRPSIPVASDIVIRSIVACDRFRRRVRSSVEYQEPIIVPTDTVVSFGKLMSGKHRSGLKSSSHAKSGLHANSGNDVILDCISSKGDRAPFSKCADAPPLLSLSSRFSSMLGHANTSFCVDGVDSTRSDSASPPPSHEPIAVSTVVRKKQRIKRQLSFTTSSKGLSSPQDDQGGSEKRIDLSERAGSTDSNLAFSEKKPCPLSPTLQNSCATKSRSLPGFFTTSGKDNPAFSCVEGAGVLPFGCLEGAGVLPFSGPSGDANVIDFDYLRQTYGLLTPSRYLQRSTILRHSAPVKYSEHKCATQVVCDIDFEDSKKNCESARDRKLSLSVCVVSSRPGDFPSEARSGSRRVSLPGKASRTLHDDFQKHKNLSHSSRSLDASVDPKEPEESLIAKTSNAWYESADRLSSDHVSPVSSSANSTSVCKDQKLLLPVKSSRSVVDKFANCKDFSASYPSAASLSAHNKSKLSLPVKLSKSTLSNLKVPKERDVSPNSPSAGTTSVRREPKQKLLSRVKTSTSMLEDSKGPKDLSPKSPSAEIASTDSLSVKSSKSIRDSSIVSKDSSSKPHCAEAASVLREQKRSLPVKSSKSTLVDVKDAKDSSSSSLFALISREQKLSLPGKVSRSMMDERKVSAHKEPAKVSCAHDEVVRDLSSSSPSTEVNARYRQRKLPCQMRSAKPILDNLKAYKDISSGSTAAEVSFDQVEHEISSPAKVHAPFAGDLNECKNWEPSYPATDNAGVANFSSEPTGVANFSQAQYFDDEKNRTADNVSALALFNASDVCRCADVKVDNYCATCSVATAPLQDDLMNRQRDAAAEVPICPDYPESINDIGEMKCAIVLREQALSSPCFAAMPVCLDEARSDALILSPHGMLGNQCKASVDVSATNKINTLRTESSCLSKQRKPGDGETVTSNPLLSQQKLDGRPLGYESAKESDPTDGGRKASWHRTSIPIRIASRRRSRANSTSKEKLRRSRKSPGQQVRAPSGMDSSPKSQSQSETALNALKPFNQFKDKKRRSKDGKQFEVRAPESPLMASGTVEGVKGNSKWSTLLLQVDGEVHRTKTHLRALNGNASDVDVPSTDGLVTGKLAEGDANHPPRVSSIRSVFETQDSFQAKSTWKTLNSKLKHSATGLASDISSKLNKSWPQSSTRLSCNSDSANTAGAFLRRQDDILTPSGTEHPLAETSSIGPHLKSKCFSPPPVKPKKKHSSGQSDNARLEAVCSNVESSRKYGVSVALVCEAVPDAATGGPAVSGKMEAETIASLEIVDRGAVGEAVGSCVLGVHASDPPVGERTAYVHDALPVYDEKRSLRDNLYRPVEALTIARFPNAAPPTEVLAGIKYQLQESEASVTELSLGSNKKISALDGTAGNPVSVSEHPSASDDSSALTRGTSRGNDANVTVQRSSSVVARQPDRHTAELSKCSMAVALLASGSEGLDMLDGCSSVSCTSASMLGALSVASEAGAVTRHVVRPGDAGKPNVDSSEPTRSSAITESSSDSGNPEGASIFQATSATGESRKSVSALIQSFEFAAPLLSALAYSEGDHPMEPSQLIDDAEWCVLENSEASDADGVQLAPTQVPDKDIVVDVPPYLLPPEIAARSPKASPLIDRRYGPPDASKSNLKTGDSAKPVSSSSNCSVVPSFAKESLPAATRTQHNGIAAARDQADAVAKHPVYISDAMPKQSTIVPKESTAKESTAKESPSCFKDGVAKQSANCVKAFANQWQSGCVTPAGSLSSSSVSCTCSAPSAMLFTQARSQQICSLGSRNSKPHPGSNVALVPPFVASREDPSASPARESFPGTEIAGFEKPACGNEKPARANVKPARGSSERTMQVPDAAITRSPSVLGARVKKMEVALVVDRDSAEPEVFKVDSFEVRRANTHKDVEQLVLDTFIKHIELLDRQYLDLTRDDLAYIEIDRHQVAIGSTFDLAEIKIDDGFLACKLCIKDKTAWSLAAITYDTLIPKAYLEKFLSLVLSENYVMFFGPSGTGKSYLARRLASVVAVRFSYNNEPVEPMVLSNVSLDRWKSLLSTVAENRRKRRVIVLDGFSPNFIATDADLSQLVDLLDGSESVVIATWTQSPSNDLPDRWQQSFRWVWLPNHEEPISGLLQRFLRRKFIQHSSQLLQKESFRIADWLSQVWHHVNAVIERFHTAEATIGPCMFYSCPTDILQAEEWFVDLWNYSISPYVLQTIKRGVRSHGQRCDWEDPLAWILQTYPWVSEKSKRMMRLRRIRMEDVGCRSRACSKDADTENNERDSDQERLLEFLRQLESLVMDGGLGDLPNFDRRKTVKPPVLESAI